MTERPSADALAEMELEAEAERLRIDAEERAALDERLAAQTKEAVEADRDD